MGALPVFSGERAFSSCKFADANFSLTSHGGYAMLAGLRE